MHSKMYSTMSLVELKQVAKTRRIKQYYIMKRHQLIHLLNMEELPATFKIEKMTIHELRDAVKAKGIRGFWNLRRDELVTLLFPNQDERQPSQASADKNKQDQRNANKHDDPQEHDPHQVGGEKLHHA